MTKEYIPSPMPFFLFGFCYYLILPYFGLVYLDNYFLVQKALDFISLDFFNIYYLIDLLVILFFWYLGYKLFFNMNYHINGKSFLDKIAYFKLSPFILFLFLCFLFIVFMFNTFTRGVVLFSGYSSYDVVVLGPFATLIFISAFFINYFDTNIAKKLFFIIFFISSAVLLGLGSRMFFVLGVITLLIGYISKNIQILKNTKFYLILFLIFGFVLFVGIWRSSNTELTTEMFVSIFIIEPIFTLTSAATYFSNVGARPIINIPTDIMAAILNFIPTIIFPDKIEILNKLIDDPNKYSPFGANALLVNIYSNFGFLYPIYFFIIGAYIGYIRKKAFSSKFFKAVYFSILPIFMFHFYREGFITVIKILFFNSFIFPFIVILLFYIVLNKNQKKVSINGY